MKSICAVVCVLSVVVLQQVSAGIRVVRDADDMVAPVAAEIAPDAPQHDHKAADPESAKPHRDLDLRKVIGGALSRLRSKASERLAEDIDMLQSALNSGGLDKILEGAKMDLVGKHFDLRQAIGAIRTRAMEGGDTQYKDLITRVTSESESLLTKLHSHAHSHLEKGIDRVKSLADALSNPDQSS